MTKHLQTLTLTLSQRIKPHEISRWRGAFLEMIGWEEELFHNHNNADIKGKKVFSTTELTKAKVYHRYPLIQYYEQDGRGTIIGINEGADALLKVLVHKVLNLRWKGRWQKLKILKVEKKVHQFAILEKKKQYHLQKWMALTQKNYELWRNANDLSVRVHLLNRLLTNHIIGVLKTFNWRWPAGSIDVQLDFLHLMETTRHKGMPLEIFNISFSCNVDLPDGLAIGKGVSHGFGILRAKK
jgi:hypothetical protein